MRPWWSRLQVMPVLSKFSLRRPVQELADFWTLFVMPGLPALLPWRGAWACYRTMSRFPLLLEGQMRERADIATQALPEIDRKQLVRRLRFVQMLDLADFYLARKTRLEAPPGEHFVVEGEWPSGPFIAVSFHYGNGMWMLRDLLRKGRRTVVVAAPFEPGDYKGRRTYLGYARARHAEMERSAGATAAYRPRVRDKLVAALTRGDVVMSLLDLPPRLVPANQCVVEILGQTASLPLGVFQLAESVGVPVVPFWIEVDARGARKLVIDAARDPHDPAANLTYFAALLDRLIRQDPAAWYFWSEWPAWMRDAAALPAPATTRPEA